MFYKENMEFLHIIVSITWPTVQVVLIQSCFQLGNKRRTILGTSYMLQY